MEHLLALPKWSWYTIYQAPDILEHGVQGAIDRSLAAGGDVRGVAPTIVPHLPNPVTLQPLDEDML